MVQAFFKEVSERVYIAPLPKYGALAKLNAKGANSVAYSVIIQTRQRVTMARHRAEEVKVSLAIRKVHVPTMKVVQVPTDPA